MWVNNLPKVATQWNSGATRESNPGPPGRIPSALTTKPLSHTDRQRFIPGIKNRRHEVTAVACCEATRVNPTVDHSTLTRPLTSRAVTRRPGGVPVLPDDYNIEEGPHLCLMVNPTHSLTQLSIQQTDTSAWVSITEWRIRLSYSRRSGRDTSLNDTACTSHLLQPRPSSAYDFLLPRSHSRAAYIDPPLCLRWYNGPMTPRWSDAWPSQMRRSFHDYV